jgi:hypothetical protein
MVETAAAGTLFRKCAEVISPFTENYPLIQSGFFDNLQRHVPGTGGQAKIIITPRRFD